MSDASRRGRRAKEVGDTFERKFIQEFREATGKELSRQLKERRDGNLGDIEIHPDVPMVFQCRKRKKLSCFSALEDALEAAVFWGKDATHYPVGILEWREPRPDDRRLNNRAAIMRAADLDDLRETFRAAGHGGPTIVWARKSGAVYPRVWDGLTEARELVARHEPDAIAGCIGHRTREGLEDVVLLDYDGWLRLVGELFAQRLW